MISFIFFIIFFCTFVPEVGTLLFFVFFFLLYAQFWVIYQKVGFLLVGAV